MGQMDRGGVITTARLSTACWLFIASYLLTESDGKISDQGLALVNNKVNNKNMELKEHHEKDQA